MESVSKGFVEEFLRAHGGEYEGIEGGRDIWVMPDGTIIQLPAGNGRIDMDHFEAIAIDQVGISYWDIDYILGQSGYAKQPKKDREKAEEQTPE